MVRAGAERLHGLAVSAPEKRRELGLDGQGPEVPRKKRRVQRAQLGAAICGVAALRARDRHRMAETPLPGIGICGGSGSALDASRARFRL